MNEIKKQAKSVNKHFRIIMNVFLIISIIVRFLATKIKILLYDVVKITSDLSGDYNRGNFK